MLNHRMTKHLQLQKAVLPKDIISHIRYSGCIDERSFSWDATEIKERIKEMHSEWCGSPCADCQTGCSLDESISCSPDCELLGEDGLMKDYRKCLSTGCDTIQMKELLLDKAAVTRWQQLVDMREVDFNKEEIDTDCTLKVWSVEFDDGYVADLKVCSGNANLFLDAILFRPFNRGLDEVCVPDCPDKIIGDHVFDDGRIGYVMRISLKTA